MGIPVVLTLAGLAETRFQPLSEAEKRLLRAVGTGAPAYCGPNDNQNDLANDPAHAAGWGADRELRAELIRWLCVDRDVAARIDPRGIRVYAGKIIHKLDLSYVTTAFPLTFERCVFLEDADLQYLKTPGLDFGVSRIRALNADGANVGGDLSFDEGFLSEGGVRLLTAQIGGSLECNGGTFCNPEGHSLWADRAKIAGSAFLGRFPKDDNPFRGTFNAQGAVYLIGAQIGGVLSCSGGSFHRPTPPAAIFVLGRA